jgi:hypothetical protein
MADPSQAAASVASPSLVKEHSRKTRNQILAAIAAIITSMGAIILMQMPQIKRLRDESDIRPLAEINRELEAEKIQLSLLKQLPTAGYDNVIADWVFLNFLQYFGDDAERQRTDYSLSPEYFEVIIPRNPRFLMAYLFLSTSTSLYAGQPERSVALMEQGLAELSPQMPGAYFAWRQKGIDELLFLGDSEAARESFEMAAEWAAQFPDPTSQLVASQSRQTAEFLARNPDSKSAQVAAWSMVLNYAPDENTQQMAIRRIEELGGQVNVAEDGTISITLPTED